MRHTETEWNAVSRYQGRIDTQLSGLGRRQVERMMCLVRVGDFEKVFSSPLIRARALAEGIAQRAGAGMEVDERLTEIAMGPWEGLTRTEIEAEFGDMFRLWHDHPDEVEFPGGETLHDVARRVDSAMRERFGDPAHTRVAIVSHDAVVKVALMLSLGLELRHLHRFRMRNGSISILRGRRYVGSVDAVDITSHLTGSPFDLMP